MKHLYNIGIIGSAGYTAGELLRILLAHPHVNIAFALSSSNAGKRVSTVHRDLQGETNLTFTDEIQPDVDVVFLCTGHGQSTEILKKNIFSFHTKIIDLSNDFRVHSANETEFTTTSGKTYSSNSFVYGLPEFQRKIISQAQYVANPGCFATCIQLGLLPAAYAKIIPNDIHISAITGSTGAGQKPTDTTHFSWRANNVSLYKAFEHQHEAEILQTLSSFQGRSPINLHFIPFRGAFTRGILSAIYFESTAPINEIITIYDEYYNNEPFIVRSETPPDVKMVQGTNKCFYSIEKFGKRILITSVIDNLLKGASGQAVQNFNIMFNLPENTGLKLRSIGF